ncbi:MAG: NAD(P)H-hydrate dehydratase [Isosphaera sp.]|nr:NAD(P)H-hydrate dehydratase [Isosphaera sp.]
MDIVPVCEVPQLPRRRPDGHKGTYGTVQVVAGSRGMAGAAVLAGRAALRAGAGLVRVACPSDVRHVVAAGYPCYTTAAIHQDPDGSFGDGAADEVVDLGRQADVVAVGPGLGPGAHVRGFVRAVVGGLIDTPVVLDADGLNAVAPFADPFPGRAAPLVLTPHPGEFARLTGDPAPRTPEDRLRAAVGFAARARVVLLLKGSGTLVTDGRRVFRNTTGNPGMATGGTGDVLTGVVAALVGQGLDPFDAAALGAWAHGRAGDLAAADLGQTGLTAADLLEHLPAAFRELEARW